MDVARNDHDRGCQSFWLDFCRFIHISPCFTTYTAFFCAVVLTIVAWKALFPDSGCQKLAKFFEETIYEHQKTAGNSIESCRQSLASDEIHVLSSGQFFILG